MLTLLVSVALGVPPECDGDPRSCFGKGKVALRKGERAEAERYLSAACRVESVELCGPLLESFSAGFEVVAEADSACHAGDGELCNRLGRFFDWDAPSSIKDRARALTLYRKACELGIGSACAEASRILFVSNRVRRDLEPMVALAERGCEDLHDPASCVRLADYLAEGRGTPADADRAIRLLDTACEEGSVDACSQAGDWAEHGFVRPQDETLAVALHAKACAGLGHVSCRALNRLLADESLVTPEAQKALETGCEGRRLDACVGLGILDAKGLTQSPLAEAQRAKASFAKGSCEAGYAPGCLRWASETTDEVLAAQLRFAFADALDKTAERMPEATKQPSSQLSTCMAKQIPAFADMQLEGRELGGQGANRAANQLASAFRDLGLGVDPEGTFEGDPNVTAVWPGKGSLADEVVVLGAHYDHLGIDADGVVYPGADDNASGVAGMVCAAAELRVAVADASERRTIAFVGFSGEEQGLAGSRQWIRGREEASRVVAMVNLDMIGRLRNDRLIVDTDAGAWMPELRAVAARSGLLLTEDTTPGRSDHVPFAWLGIPAVHLSSGPHGDYHRPTDTVERVNVEGATRIAQATVDVVGAVGTAARAPQLARGACTQPKLAFGYGISMEDFIHPPNARRKNMAVRCVEEGSPADRIGLREGDVVVSSAVDLRWWPTRARLVTVEREGQCLVLAQGRKARSCEAP